MSVDLERAKEILRSADYTCVLCREDVILTTQEWGVLPLLRWLGTGADTSGCYAADKVVGKATALLYCLLGVRCVHGNVMSTAAVKVLRQHGIEAHWDTLTEFIRNRAGTDLCPIESATAQIDDPEEALQAILSKLASLESAQY